jgi:hypothetical protein
MKMRTVATNIEDYPERLESFLDHIRCGYSPGDAARRARLARAAVMRLIKDDRGFESDYLDALDEGTDYLEGVARRRAVRDSDRLLIFLLQSRNREKYGNANGTTVSGDFKIDFKQEAEAVKQKLDRLTNSTFPESPKPKKT